MTVLSKRRQAAIAREAVFWGDRMRRAQSPAQRAAVAFDRLRARIADYPHDQQAHAWAEIETRIANMTAAFPLHEER